MARQETIEVILKRAGNYESTVKSLQAEADKLKETFGSIKVGDSVNAIKAQASASKEAAKAAQEQAKAEKEAVTAEKARYSAVKELENATKAHLSAQKEAQSVTSEQMRTQREVARATAEWAKASKEATNAETAQIRQTQLLSRESERQATAMRRLGDAVGSVNKDQATSIQYMTEWIHQQQGMANATVTATGAIHNSAGSFQTYNAAVTEAGGVTHNYRFAVENAEGAVYQLDKGIKTTTVSIRDLSSVLRAVRTVIGFTGIAQSLRSAFSEMKDMSDQLAEYRKVTGATAQEMEQIRATAYDIAKAYGESASDVIASAANMARAGYRENSVAMAELATKTKLVGDMTQEAADKFLIAIDAAYKYQGNVEQLSAVLDAANEIDNNFATTIEKISDGMTLVASLASTAHVPIEQLMAALGTMTAVTQRSGSETARGLRSIILNVLGDTTTEIEEGVTATKESVKSMTDALIKYGDASVKAAIQAGKVINPMEAIVALQKAWKENQITEQDLYQISNDVAGKRYYNVFTALIQNPEMYNEMLQSISQSVGSAANEVGILMDSWSRKLEQLKTTWTELVNKSITEGFIKDLIDGGTAALKFAGSLENLATMASGALVAIRALNTGFTNLGSNQAFGGFNIATTAIGLGITAIGYIKAAYEANQKRIQEEAEQAVQSAVASATTYNSLEELTKRYDEIAKDGIQGEQGELEELKSLQEQLNSLVGDQADAIDIVNGKYGDTLVALQKLTEEQKRAIRTNLSTAVNDFNLTDINGNRIAMPWEEYTQIGDYAYNGSQDALINKYLQKSNSKYFRSRNGNLQIKKPNNLTAEEIIELYNEAQALFKYLGAYTSSGTLAKTGEKTIGEEMPFGAFNSLTDSFETLLSAAERVVNIYNVLQKEEDGAKKKTQDQMEAEAEAILSKEKFAEKTFESKEAIEKYIKALSEENKLDEESAKILLEKALAMGTIENSVDSLASSIEAATNAKKDFDKAMETTKADAFNDYMEAFDTFKSELDAGRVNSTAMYAAARMMLGEDAYNAAGGTYQGVMAAINASGSAGSVLDAYNILNTKYQDANGNAVEGFGVYELIRKSGLYSESQLYDKEGNYYIPEMTTDDISRISAAYGGILEEVIINALNALDQYDIYGDATDDLVKTEIKDSEEETADALDDMKTSVEDTTEAIDDLAESVEKLDEKIEETTGGQEDSALTSGGSKWTGEWKQTASKVFGGVADAFSAASEATKAAAAEKTAEAQQKAAEAAQAASNSLNNAITSLNTLNATGGNADIIAMLNGLNNLKETYEIAIEAVGGTGTTEEKLAAIAEALNTVDSEKEIAVSVGLPGTEEGYEAVKAALLAEANGLIADVNDEDELHDIACTLVADDGTVLNSDIDALLRARQTDIVTVQVNAETAPASSQIASVENGAYSATIETSADTDAAKAEIAEACSAPYSATINVQDGGTTNDVKAEIMGASSGPYDATVNVSQNGAEETQTVIQTVADEPYDAKIKVKESGTATARKRITETADAEYNATIHVDDNGTTQTVIDKIDTALEKLGYVEDVDVDPEIEDLVENLNAIKESYTVSIKDGEGTKSTSTLIRGISNALKTIDELKDAGVIDVEFATETSDALLEEVNAIIGAVNSDDELEEIWIALEGDDYPITKEIFDILHKKRDSLRLNVSANTGEAETAISKVESGPYKADVNVGDGGTASETQTGIQTVADGPYNATILAEESGSETAKAAIEDAANGPYNSSIEVSENGATAAKAEIAAATSGPFDATINTSESGSSIAQTKIQSAADGPYDASVNVSDNGTADAVQGKIDAITGKNVGVTLSVENESSFTSKVDELTKPETKTINIEYNEPITETGLDAQNSGSGTGNNTHVVAQEHIQQVPDNLLAGVVSTVIDNILGTNLYDGLPKHDNPEEPPIYDDGYFRPVTHELVEEVNAQREAEEEAAAVLAESSDKLESFYNAIQQYGGFFQAVNYGGLNYQSDVLQPYILLRYGVDGLPEGESISKEAIEAFLSERFGLDEPLEQTIEVDADTSEAVEEADEAVEKISKKHATISVGISSTSGGGLGKETTALNFDSSAFLIKPYKHATGTMAHPGGISLVNDGNGAELLVDQGRAFIANDGKPALVNLHKDAKVFTASETRQILGNGVPAYSIGTTSYSLTDGSGSKRKTNTGVTSSTILSGVTVVPTEEVQAAAETAATSETASATFSSLTNLIDYIIERIGIALDEQVEIIDKQIAELKAQREAAEQQNELEEKRQNLADALGNRTVRYIDENGQWHWMADANKVQKAQKDLADYEDELAFNAQVDALEAQKTALQDQYKEITKAWSDIQYAVNTPTGDLYQMLAEVIATGSDTDKKGAETVQNLLITQLLKGGIFSGNYEEALDSIEKATAGNPIMPGESESTLASLIATASGMGTGTETMEAMKAATMGTIPGVNTSGLAEGGTQIIYNYFINGVQLGSDQASQPLSSIMRNLTVYANTGVVA